MPKSSSDFNLDTFITDVKTARRDSGGQAAVEEVLRRAISDPAAIMAELGEPEEADLHRIYSDDDVTILNVIWPPLISLLPHNHNMWASIGIYTGRENNIVWERDGSVIEPTGAAALSEKEVYRLPDDAIHSVTNPITRFTGAIHIYGGNYFNPGRSEWDAETLLERPFDLDRAREEFRKAAERFSAVP
jgi:predicted metal-dependent enzyme (double-stranded beta helix superfamily)